MVSLMTAQVMGKRGHGPPEAFLVLLRQTHLGFLSPERKCLLLTQHPGNNREAQLASK